MKVVWRLSTITWL